MKRIIIRFIHSIFVGNKVERYESNKAGVERDGMRGRFGTLVMEKIFEMLMSEFSLIFSSRFEVSNMFRRENYINDAF